MNEIIRIPVGQNEFAYATEFVENNQIANRNVFDGNKRNQFVGILGQIVFYKYIYNEIPVLSEGFDHGIDLTYKGYSIDVKTMERKVFVKEYFANNFTSLQKHFIVDVLMFLSYNSNTDNLGVIEICGWIFKNDLEEKSIFRPKGSIVTRADNSTFTLVEDLYEIPMENLNPFRKI